MLVAGTLEFLGVGSVLPFMRVVADPSVVYAPGPLGQLYELSGLESPRAAVVATGLLLLAAIIANNAFNAAMVWMISRWGWGLNHRMSVDLLERYVRRPYEFFLGRNTATLSRTLLAEVSTVVSGVLIPGMAVAARSVGVCMIIGLLAWADPVLALFLAVSFAGGYAAVYAGLRRGQRERGRERFEHNGARYRVASEALQGIKEVKALGREDEFVRRFSTPSARFAGVSSQHQIVSAVPRYLLETVAASAIVAMVLISSRGETSVTAALPTLSLFVFGAYRLMPSLNAIFRGVVALRFNAPALEALHSDFSLGVSALHPEALVREQGPSMSASPPDIEIRDVSFRYPGADVDAVRHLDLRIPAGQTVGFVGRTGGGKTTIVDLVLGLLQPTQGVVVGGGVAISPLSAERWRGRCGYVPQDVFVSDDTVAANIAFGIPTDERIPESVEAAARAAQIHDFIEGLPDGYDTVVGERGIRMSGGQRQRLGIARALYRRPEVLVFDEATSALDGLTEAAVLDTMYGLGGGPTLLVIAHRLTTVRACDVIYMLEAGEVVASGSYDELIKGHDGFRAMAEGVSAYPAGESL